MAECYLCGSKSPSERDHVPPRSFFPRTEGLKLITVPICTACHDSYDNIDERMRNYFLVADGNSSKADSLRKGKLLRGLNLNRPQKRQIVQSLRPTWRKSASGLVSPRILFNLPADEATNFLARTAKGLLFHHCGCAMYSDMAFDVTLFQSQSPNDLFNFPFVLNEFVIDSDVFRYRIGTAADSETKQVALVYMEFYSAIGALVYFSTVQSERRSNGPI